jgi:hypothetical protein
MPLSKFKSRLQLITFFYVTPEISLFYAFFSSSSSVRGILSKKERRHEPMKKRMKSMENDKVSSL